MNHNRISISLTKTTGLAIVYLATAVSLAHADHRQVVIETDGTQFKVISQKVFKQDIPKIYRLTLNNGSYYVEGKTADGTVVDAQSLADPSLVSYDYLTQPSRSTVTGTIPLTGGTLTPAQSQLVIKLPVDKSISQLKIYREKVDATKKGAEALSPALVNPNSDLPTPLPPQVTLELKATLDLDTATIGGQQ